MYHHHDRLNYACTLQVQYTSAREMGYSTSEYRTGPVMYASTGHAERFMTGGHSERYVTQGVSGHSERYVTQGGGGGYATGGYTSGGYTHVSFVCVCVVLFYSSFLCHAVFGVHTSA
jgi:hypothetical protein